MGEEAPHATNNEGAGHTSADKECARHTKERAVHTSADMECVGHTSDDVECAGHPAAHAEASSNERGDAISTNEKGSANENADEEGDLMLPLVAKGGALLKVHFLKDHEVHLALNLEVGCNFGFKN